MAIEKLKINSKAQK